VLRWTIPIAVGLAVVQRLRSGTHTFEIRPLPALPQDASQRYVMPGTAVGLHRTWSPVSLRRRWRQPTMSFRPARMCIPHRVSTVAVLSCAATYIKEYDQAALREVAHHRRSPVPPRDLPARWHRPGPGAVTPATSGQAAAGDGSLPCRCGGDLQGAGAITVPQLDVPVMLNVQQEPL
jgi:hypothetical protein